ncbi:succinate--CoA ligase subunit alpha [Poseidonocella sedimentorum]|uniref:Succinyl-CoA synthetase alpha subunit n=1 Tax=Poseidonocella sedimentorum TaxID=871652 RepID=A0A1I6CS83_9RHOB|nr:succinate--CoA ligase subunit alpha [Poseidonocella sedimentorum]SFQ96094.1 succinyl-CoA synthetase alpha subunit [Poseidonocella sedimentorum]
MGIIVTKDTRVIVQGMTGRAGTFYTDQAMRYAPSYVGGVRPGRGGTKHLGLPVFHSVAEAREATGADASFVTVPAPNAADAMIEAIEAGIETIVCVTERVPQHDMARVKRALAGRDTVLIGPNSQGILTPEQCKIGVMPTVDARPGGIGIASRSASLTSEILANCSAANLGQSTTVGVGGDTIHGIGFVDCLTRFRDDPDTEAVILIGEIGGREEEKAADYLSGLDYGKPVIGLVAGRHAPAGRRMGHAGTLSVFGLETAEQKQSRLRAAGVLIARDAADVVRTALKALQ